MSSLQKSLLHGSLVSSQASVVDSVLLGVLCRIIMAMLSAFGGEAVCTAVVMSAVGGAPALQVSGRRPRPCSAQSKGLFPISKHDPDGPPPPTMPTLSPLITCRD